MAIEKIYARFLRPVSVPEKGKKTVKIYDESYTNDRYFVSDILCGDSCSIYF